MEGGGIRGTPRRPVDKRTLTPEERGRFRAGDPSLFRDLVEMYSPRLLGVCAGFADDSDAAHDLVQETWTRVFSKRRSYLGGSFAAWLFTVCRRICLSAVRRRPLRLAGPPLDLVADSSVAGSPERGAARAELRASVSRALFDLPPRQREVVVLRLLEGCSTRETAALMGCAEGTVKAALHQALAKLAEPLRPHAETTNTYPSGALG